MSDHKIPGPAREFAERTGFAWTRHDRRRLARADAGPGRRFAVRQPKSIDVGRDAGTRDALVAAALLAVPGLRRRDVRLSTPEPGTVRVEVPAAMRRLVEVAIAGHVPLAVCLDVVATG